jgi:hypothetical protein
VMTGVCLLAWTMFVVHLGSESMWMDEWFSWKYALQGPFALVRDTAQDVHPPLYYQLLWLWITFTGDQSMFVMRLTAAFPALLAVALSYRLAREWFKSHMAGVAAAVFLGTSGIFVYYARELRMYALIVLLVTLSWWFLTRFLQGRKGSLLGYIACVGLMSYTYYFSAFVLVAQVIIVLWFYRDKFKRLLLAYGAVLLLFLPWLPIWLNQMFWERARTANPDAPLLGKYAATVPTTLANITAFIKAYTAGQPAFVFLLIALAVALGWRWTRGLPSRRWVIAAGLWLFLTIVLMFGLNLLFPIYNQRYLLTVVPALALLIGVAARGLADRRAAAALIGVIALSGMVFHADAFLPEKPPHQNILRTVAAEFRPGDRIWYNFSYGGLGSSLEQEMIYHLQFDAPNLSTDDFVWNAPSDYADAAAVPRVWDARPYWIPIPEQAAGALTSDRVLSEAYTFGAYTLRLYEAPPIDGVPVQVGDLFTMLSSGAHKTAYRAGDSVVVKTWWQTDTLPTLDYSYALYLRAAGSETVIAQADAGLVADTIPTSQWTPDQGYRLSQLRLELPGDLSPDQYELWAGVYYWQDPQRLTMQTSGATPISADGQTAQIAAFMVTD